MLVEVDVDVLLGAELVLHLLSIHLLHGSLLALGGLVVLHREYVWIFKVIIRQYLGTVLRIEPTSENIREVDLP